MITLKTISILFLSAFIFSKANSQVFPNNDILHVLHYKKVGKIYKIDKSKILTEHNKIYKDFNRLELIYLGEIQTKKGVLYKIINSRWFWGISQRATSRIYIYNNKNQYIGNYYLTMTSDLPVKIRNGSLVFENTHNDDCDPKLKTYINFRNGIPKQFFRKCKGKEGDIFSFQTDY